LDLVSSVDPLEKIPPLDVYPLEYVSYSRMFRVKPETSESLLSCARDLLDRGADPNCYRLFREGDNESRIPVLYGAAGESGHVGIVRLLLERGAEPNDGESIYHAAEHDFEDVLSTLVEFGADLSGRHPVYGNTPLYFLCYFRESHPSGATALRGMRWLLEHGADPNVTSAERKETPLQHACRLGRGAEVISLLLSHGADQTLRDANGNTAIELAMLAGNQDAIRLLKADDIHLNPDQSFLVACAADDEPTIQQMLAGDANLINRLADQAAEQMHRFAEANQISGLRGLLFAGFPAVGKSMMTPLHFACINGLVEPVKILLAHGAPLDIRDEEHNSVPFGWATWGSIFNRNALGDYPQVVRLLLAAGSSRDEAQKQLEWPELGEDVKQAIRDSL